MVVETRICIEICPEHLTETLQFGASIDTLSLLGEENILPKPGEAGEALIGHDLNEYKGTVEQVQMAEKPASLSLYPYIFLPVPGT